MRSVLYFLIPALTFSALSIAMPAQAEDPVAVGDLRIMHPWARASAGQARTGAAFMTIINTGGEADRLVSATTGVAKKAEIHESSMENGVMKMRMLMDGLSIPANGEVTLKPMGLHVMMTGLTGKLVEGKMIDLTLTFEKAGSVEISVPIGGPAAMMAPGTN